MFVLCSELNQFVGELSDVEARSLQFERLIWLRLFENLGREAHLSLPHQDDSLPFRGVSAKACHLDFEDIERAAPMRVDPPGRMQHHRTAKVPALPRTKDVHADAILDPGLVGDMWGGTRSYECDEKQAVLGKDSVHLEQPAAPRLRQVRENRNRVDQIERFAFNLERRELSILEDVEWRAERIPQPLHAVRIDVTRPEIALGGLVQEMAERTAGAATEIKDALAAERPVRWKHREDRIPSVPTKLVIDRKRILEVGEGPDAVRELEGWERWIESRWCGSAQD
jgi:hypothetical protein